jgi:hypothetical protein
MRSKNGPRNFVFSLGLPELGEQGPYPGFVVGHGPGGTFGDSEVQ